MKRFFKRMRSPKYRAWLLVRISVVMSLVLCVTAVVGIVKACTTGHAAKNEEINETETETVAAFTKEVTNSFTDPIEPTAATEEVTECTESPEVIAEEEPAYIFFDVPLSEDLQIHIFESCEEYDIDPAIIVAMACKESTYNASAIGDNGDSYGLLQIQPYWHYGRMVSLGCTDLLDPFQNVTVGVDFLCEQLNRYGGDMAKALTAYNQGHYNGTVTGYAYTILSIAEELKSELIPNE